MADRLDIDFTAIALYEDWLLEQGGQPWLDAYHALPFAYAAARAKAWAEARDYTVDRRLMRDETYGDNL